MPPTERPPAPFHQWMADALYGPNGYYSTNISTVGRLGDFSTSAGLSDLLPRAIARWATAELAHWDGAGSPISHIIECGAGDGSMLEGVAKAFGRLRRWRRGIRFHIVEVSPGLRARQQRLLRHLPVSWHEEVGDALAAAGGKALVYSNEFADAFPTTLLEKTEGGWAEVHILEDRGGNFLREELVPYEALPATSSAFTTGGFETGDRIEVHPSYRAWLEGFAPALGSGSLLTIDYGEEIERLYHRRPRGTLRAYFKHQTLQGPAIYQRKGRQDLTADINFTDLVEWGTGLGLAAIALQSQREFILTHLPEAASQRHAPSAAAMLDPDSAGGAFQVLHQRKG